MAGPSKKHEKKGFFGRLFGGKKEGEGGEDAATPQSETGGGDMTIAPGYAGPPGGAGDVTMAPGYNPAGGPPPPGGAPDHYWHKPPEHSDDAGHVSFGGQPKASTNPGAAGSAPGYSAVKPGSGPSSDEFDMDAGERTMAPGYAGELKRPVGNPFGVDGDAQPMGTLVPGYSPQGGANPAADPFGFGEGDAPMGTIAPGYSQPPGAPAVDPFDFGEGDAPMGTIAPGYSQPGKPGAGKPPGPGGAAADPFDFDAGSPMGTIAPGYAQPGKPGKGPAPAPKGAGAAPDPFDFDAGSPMGTIAPGYAQPGAGAPDPFDFGPPPGKADPFDFGPAPGSAPAADPFDFGASERTMVPSYGAAGRAPGAADPFATGAIPASAKGKAAPEPDPFDFGEPLAPAGPAGEIPADAFDFGDPAPAPARPTAGRGSPPAPVGDPLLTVAPGYAPQGGSSFDDPFGAAILDDPGPGGVATAPVPAAAAAKPAPVVEDDDFRGERTMVEFTADVDSLANLRQTDDELPVVAAAPAAGGAEIGELELEGALDLSVAPAAAAAPPVGAASPPLAAQPPPMMPRATAPIGVGHGGQPIGVGHGGQSTVAAPSVRRPFGSQRETPAGLVLGAPAPEVVVGAGVAYAAAPRGATWADVPGFTRLQDGALVGRVQAQPDGSLRVQRPVRLESVDASDGHAAGVRLPAAPPSARVDRVTRVVLVPRDAEAGLGWPLDALTTIRREQDLVVLLPAGARFEADGSVVIPPLAARAAEAAQDPVHGRVTSRLVYLGIVETAHADGWTRLDLPEGAEVDTTASGRRLLLPASVKRGEVPPLLRVERTAGGRLAVALPAAAQLAGRTAWLPGAPAEEAQGEPWDDRTAAVVDTQTYLGVREELLADGWVRLELPAGARVEPAAPGGEVGPVLVIPAEYAQLGDRAAALELERRADGSLTFELPRDAEALGPRVLIPPAPTPPGPDELGPARGRSSSRASSTSSSSRTSTSRGASTSSASTSSASSASSASSSPAASASPDELGPARSSSSSEPEPASKKMKALDRFRNKKPLNDEVTFDGVLRSDDAPAADANGGSLEAKLATSSETGPAASSEKASSETTSSETGPAASKDPLSSASSRSTPASGSDPSVSSDELSFDPKTLAPSPAEGEDTDDELSFDAGASDASGDDLEPAPEAGEASPPSGAQESGGKKRRKKGKRS